MIPRCNIFVLSTDVIKWFYHRKKKPKADLSSGFNDGKFISSTQLIKPIFLFQSSPYQPIQDSPKTFAQLPLTVTHSISRAGCLVRTKSDWPNLTGLGPAITNFYCVRYSRHYSLDYFVLVNLLSSYILRELDVIMWASSFHFWQDNTLKQIPLNEVYCIGSVTIRY